MRYFLDTEFIDDGSTIELISIGVVCEDGRLFYAESNDINWDKASPWVIKNVMPHVGGGRGIAIPVSDIALRLYAWISSTSGMFDISTDLEEPETPEFWGWTSAYDWVVLCQLFGPMVNLPREWPKHCNDLKTLAMLKGANRDDLPQQVGKAHNALEDAKWNREVYGYLMGLSWD